MKTKISFDGLLAIWFFSLSLLKKMDRLFLLLDIFVEKNNFYAFIRGRGGGGGGRVTNFLDLEFITLV